MPSFVQYLARTTLAVCYYASLASATGVILPLYTWPSDSTWEPVYNALAAYPNVDFYVIVNPNSGPGDSSPPASDYITGVETLNSYPNAHTLGYVRTNWADRDISEVKADIDIYSQWASYDTSSTSTNSRRKRSPCRGEDSHPNFPWTTTTTTPTFAPTTFVTSAPATYTSSSTSASAATSTPTTPSSTVNTGLTLSGIFFDEAPQSSDTADISYMQEVAEYVQSKSTAFSFASTSNTNTPTIVFNPGTAPADEYFNYATHIVDFESTYSAWLQQSSGEKTGLAAGIDSMDYSQSAIIINSVPEDVDYAAVIDSAVSKGVALMYLTSDYDYKSLDSVQKVAAAISDA